MRTVYKEDEVWLKLSPAPEERYFAVSRQDLINVIKFLLQNAQVDLSVDDLDAAWEQAKREVGYGSNN